MMLIPKPSDALHKAWLYRLLSAIADCHILAVNLAFKGGTCAAMREMIDRFSIDLDFDLIYPEKTDIIREELERIFKELGLEIKDKSQNVPQYFLKYPNKEGERSTIKLDITCPPPKKNAYEMVRLPDIDRVLTCQTVDSMFANKMVAILERYQKFGSIAGRDLYDIHTFFIKGFRFKEDIIEERTGKKAALFLKDLRDFIEKRLTQTIIDQDLNTLLLPERFKAIRKILKQEVLLFI